MSHAVHRLSFGKSFPRKEDPLSGFTRTTRHANETGTYKYFLKVVPVTYTGKSSPSALKAYERKFRRESAALAIETKRKKKRLEKMRARGVEGGGGGGGGGRRRPRRRQILLELREPRLQRRQEVGRRPHPRAQLLRLPQEEQRAERPLQVGLRRAARAEHRGARVAA